MENEKCRRRSPLRVREGIAWTLAICVAAYALTRPRCPYVWNGGNPNGTPRGSCWVGALDGYAMCTPSLAIDLVIESGEDGVILVLRRDSGLYATMGGYVEVGESPRDAVRRELGEETGLDLVGEPTLLGVYGDPRRDRRRHTVSITYIARTRGHPRAGSDVKSVEVVPFDELPRISLAFDHRTIIDDYIVWRQAAPREPVVVVRQRPTGGKSNKVDDIQRDTCQINN
ncbi:hypothetical protein CTAYLR_002069 [Chrysophaeum taylorii]|uniref:Nudix hydrolase domain-containing protein n=1 Tax=Chrysophaeum taylorii TaxID=2483200 RepID=A0AAD7UMI4_9STRA|nr:hypothetical protein CTAYLR_002069 [Chrysophaeum taylorii]